MIFRHKGFFPFLLSQFVSLIGNRMSTLAFVSLIVGIIHDDAGAKASNIAAIQVIPIFFLSYLGGLLSDRLSRKWLMWWFDVVRCLVILIFIILARTVLSTGLIYMCVLVLGVFSALFNPVKRSIVPFLVPGKDLETADWWLTSSEIVAMGLGIALGSALLNFLSPLSLLFLDSASFLIALLILLFIPNVKAAISRANQTGFLHDMMKGWRYVRERVILKRVLGGIILPFYLAGGLFYAIANRWAAAKEPDNAGKALGIILMFLAFGALLSFLLRPYVEKWKPFFATGVIFCFGACIAFLILIQSPTDYISVGVLYFLMGIAVGLLYMRTIYFLHSFSGKEYMGRVVGLGEIVSGISFAGMILLTGAMGPFFTTSLGLWFFIAIFLAAGAFMFRFHRTTKVPDKRD